MGSKITADDDCSHEIKRRLLLGRKAMTKLGSIASRDSSGFGAMEEGLTSRGDRNLRIPLRFILKIKSVTVSIISPSICHKVMGPDAMILVF